MRASLVGRYLRSIIGLALRALPVAGLVLAVLAFAAPASPAARSIGPAHGEPVQQRTAVRPQPSEDWPDISPRQGLRHDPPSKQGPSDVGANGWTNLYPQLNEVSAISNTEAWAVGE